MPDFVSQSLSSPGLACNDTLWLHRARHMLCLASLSLTDHDGQERRWRYIRAGKAQDYHGPAVHPRHLSLWEKRVLGVHKQYNPERNREQRALAQKHGWDDDEAAMHAGEGI